MDAARVKAGKQYVVFHLKLMEVLHLTLISVHLTKTKSYPDNVLDHGVNEFKETLLGATINAFMSLCDRSGSTNAREIWKQIYPKHTRAIDRIWDRKIRSGESVMKAYRDQAGAHGDSPQKYFAARIGLIKGEQEVLAALKAFLGLSICLLNRQGRELPDFASEVEGLLLDVELGLGANLNRRWLRKMRVIESGSYTKKFR